jgi:demethylmenaquinone methyltransferase/2-methoxy-6-polyprenyl-1,4-benzoquinol methylase
VQIYYERRAREYDDWWLGTGLHAGRHRPGWHESVIALTESLAALPPAATLDVACGTGFLTQHLPGTTVGLDQSESMLAIARERLPHSSFVQGNALQLPFPDSSFERLFTSFFYGHLEEEDRLVLLNEVRRAAGELVVVDSALNEDHEPVEWQERVLKDGSAWQVYKRFFTAEGLAEDLGGGEPLYESRWFVAVRC